MTDEEYIKLKAEYEQTRAQLSKCYLAISGYYKRMSKVADGVSFSSIQSGIDSAIKEAETLKGKLLILQKQIVDNWDMGC